MKHPAKFSKPILEVLKTELDHYNVSGVLLDPFAGAGGIHELDYGQRATWGVELEPEWAALHPRTLVGSALALPFMDETFSAIVTSPCYGNRMADRDMRESVAGTYAKSLGRHASEGSACHLQWGQDYREFHRRAWWEAERVLQVGGLFFLNISDHIRGGKRQRVAAWHIQALTSWAFQVLDVIPVRTPRQRNGANANARVDAELVIVLEKT